MRSQFGIRVLSGQPGTFLRLLRAGRFDMDINDNQFLLVFCYKDLLTELLEFLPGCHGVSLASEGFGNLLILGIRVQMGDSVFFGLSLESSRATIDPIIVDNEDNSPEFVAGEGLAFHSTEPESTVAHDSHSPEIRVGRLSGYNG